MHTNDMRRASRRAAAAVPAPLRSLLVPIDLTPTSDRLLGRVALLPLAKNAVVTVLHVIPQSLTPRQQATAERDAVRALVVEARHLRKSLPHGISVNPIVVRGAAVKEIAACATKVHAELIIMGRGGARAVREAFLGSTAERVIRRAKVPVLVVRLPPRSAYARPALAVDLDGAGQDAVRGLLRLLPPPRPVVVAYSDVIRSAFRRHPISVPTASDQDSGAFDQRFRSFDHPFRPFDQGRPSG